MNVIQTEREPETSNRTWDANSPETVSQLTLLERLHYALGPLAAGIIIDTVDLVLFGPFGIVLGPLLGGLAGWWVSSIYGFGTRGRLIVAIVAAVYITIPFTELLPLATMVAAVGRFSQSSTSVRKAHHCHQQGDERQRSE